MPPEQRRILEKKECKLSLCMGLASRLIDPALAWLPSEPGFRFPTGNIPLQLLKLINESLANTTSSADTHAYEKGTSD